MPLNEQVHVWLKDPFANSYSAKKHLYQILTLSDFILMSYLGFLCCHGNNVFHSNRVNNNCNCSKGP